MPLLESGRAVGVQPKQFVDEAIFDAHGDLQEITFGYRPRVDTLHDLLNLLPIVYFDVENGRPVMESMRESGFTFGEVIAGADNWTAAEIAELKAWADTNADLQAWLREHFAAIKRQELQDRDHAEGE